MSTPDMRAVARLGVDTDGAVDAPESLIFAVLASMQLPLFLIQFSITLSIDQFICLTLLYALTSAFVVVNWSMVEADERAFVLSAILKIMLLPSILLVVRLLSSANAAGHPATGCEVLAAALPCVLAAACAAVRRRCLAAACA